MSHVICHKCGSNDHIQGYGLAVGPMGAYTYCDNCDELLEFSPDLEGVSEDQAKEIQRKTDEWRKSVTDAQKHNQ